MKSHFVQKLWAPIIPRVLEILKFVGGQLVLPSQSVPAQSMDQRSSFSASMAMCIDLGRLELTKPIRTEIWLEKKKKKFQLF